MLVKERVKILLYYERIVNEITIFKNGRMSMYTGKDGEGSEENAGYCYDSMSLIIILQKG